MSRYVLRDFGFPRTRGDEPPGMRFDELSQLFSPHARG